MLREISIKNFKSIGEPGIEKLELKPLTLLVGPNGGGKSTILEAIVFWTKWLGVNIHPPIAPPLPHFIENFENLVHRRQKDKEILIEVLLDSGERWKATFRKSIQVFQITEGGEIPPNGQTLTQIRNALQERVFFISAFRGRVEFESPPADIKWVGPLGENLLNILNYLNEPEYYDQKKSLTEWGKKFGIEALWSGIPKGRDRLTALYRDFREHLPLALASYGNRQVMSILVNLIWAEPESIHLIEEPEISLHPEQQVRILEFLAEMVRQGRKILATTHSHFILSALGIPISKEVIGLENIAVYHVEKNKEGTIVQPLNLTKDAYIEGGVPSFTPVQDEVTREWAKTL